MRKIDRIAFKITGYTNFKKELTSFVSKFGRENQAESQNCKNSDAWAIYMLLFYDRSLNYSYEWS